jgi:hypothetical protein
MDVFGLRNRVIGDYASYIRSFFTIRDERIKEKVDVALAEGHLWPDPLLQLSPAFEPGETIEELIASGELRPEARKIFAIKREDGTVRSVLRLHRHQVEGIRAAGAVGACTVTPSVISSVHDRRQLRQLMETILPDTLLGEVALATGFQQRDRKRDAVKFLRTIADTCIASSAQRRRCCLAGAASLRGQRR